MLFVGGWLCDGFADAGFMRRCRQCLRSAACAFASALDTTRQQSYHYYQETFEDSDLELPSGAYTLFSMLREGQISGKAFLQLLFGTAQSLPPEDQNYEFKSLDLLRRAAKGEKDARIKLFRTVSAFAANKRGSSSFLILGIR
ncbi:MAG: hypothetical protein DRP82_07610, partial [Planctomycetota bacterium]